MKRSDWLKANSKKRYNLYWPNHVLGKILLVDRESDKIISIQAFDPTGQTKHVHLLEETFLKEGSYNVEQAFQFWETESLTCYYIPISTSGMWRNELDQMRLETGTTYEQFTAGVPRYFNSIPEDLKFIEEVVNHLSTAKQSQTEMRNNIEEIGNYVRVSGDFMTGNVLNYIPPTGLHTTGYVNFSNYRSPGVYFNNSESPVTITSTSATAIPTWSFNYDIEEVEE